MTTLRTTYKITASVVWAGLVLASLIAITGCAIRGASTTNAASTEQAPEASDFIQRWLILEPISVNGLTQSAVRATIERENFSTQLSMVPRDGEKVTINSKEYTWHAIETNDYNFNLYYFANGYGKPTSNVLFWAVTVINCPQDMPNVRLAIGSNAASVWWVNGQEVIGIYNERQTVIDDGVSPLLTLKKGPNVIRAAIINAGGATDFCGRLIDADEKPLKGFTVSLSGTGK